MDTEDIVLRETDTKTCIMCVFLPFPKYFKTCLSALDDDAILWHKRLGHASLSLLNKLVSKDLVVGLPTIKYNDGKVCDACAKGKQVKKSFKSKSCVSTSRPLEMLHIDLCGPMRILSRGGKRYVCVLGPRSWLLKMKLLKNLLLFSKRLKRE